MSGVEAAAEKAKGGDRSQVSGDAIRNVIGYGLAGVAALTLMMSLSEKAWAGVGCSLLVLPLAWLLTAHGKAQRRKSCNIPGLLIGPIALGVLFAAMTSASAPAVEAKKQAWAQNGPQAMVKARKALEMANHQEALDALAPFDSDTADSDELKSLKLAAKTLKQFGGDNMLATRKLMEEVAENPEDQVTREAAQALHPVLADKLAAEQASAAEYKRLRRFFSSWDGSHPQMVEAVKEHMNDPASFEHVDTAWAKDKAGTISVMMRYRGRNGFGGVVTEAVVGTVNQDTGQLIHIASLK